MVIETQYFKVVKTTTKTNTCRDVKLSKKRNDHFFDERKIAQPYPKEDMITLRVAVPMAVLSLSRIAVFRNSEEVVKSVSSVFQ